MFRLGFLLIRTLYLIAVEVNDHQYDNFTKQVQKFGVRFVVLTFDDENFAGTSEVREWKSDLSATVK